MKVSKKELATLRELISRAQDVPEVVTVNWNCSQGFCSSTCSGSCSMSCQTGCLHGCLSTCRSGCQNSCQYACQSGGAQQRRW